MLHEDGWYITGDPDGEVVFHLPTGKAFEWRPGDRSWQVFQRLDLAHLHEWIEQHDLAKPGPG